MQGIDPLKYYERQGKHSESCPHKTAYGALTAGSNRQIVAAVTGKRIRVMGYQIQSSTSTQGAYLFKDGSGGTQLAGSFTAPPSTVAPHILPIHDAGYFETTSGTGLYMDISTATVQVEVHYIEYTP